MDLVGQTLGGCRIDELVGRGGMGEVYRAVQLSLEREVAVKVLAMVYAQNEEFRNRFLREARSIARVNHPNILQIYEAGEHEGVNFMVMEFIHGESVAERLQQRGFIEWREAIGYVIQAARGLESAAKVNIIHRDVKPDNLMVTEEGVVKVSDFGLAKECASGAELTHTDSIMGTPAYMSPEQCDGVAELDTRTDIYSLGGTLYRIVTGVLPFNAPTAVAMMYKHKHESLVPPEQYMPSLPRALTGVIGHMMAKERADRYQSMSEVVEALEAVLAKPDEPTDGEMTMKVDGGGFSFGDKPPPNRGLAEMQRQRHSDTAARSAAGIAELISKGEAYMQAGRPVAALTCWQKALSLDPGNEDLRARIEKAKSESTVASLRIAENLLEDGGVETQRRDLQQALQIDPDNIDAMEKLQALDMMEARKRQVVTDVRRLLSTSRYREALELWDSLHPSLRDKTLQKTVDHVREHVLPLQRLCQEAESLTEAGKLQEALAKWEEAAALDESNDKVQMGLQQAQRYLQRVETLMREAYENEMQGKVAPAVEAYDQVLKLMPAHPQAGKKQLECLREAAARAESQHRPEEALQLWEQVLARAPEHAEARERLEHLKGVRAQLKAYTEEANTALRRGRYSRAISRYTDVLRLDPGRDSAKMMREKARRNRLYRKQLPLLGLVLILAAGAVVAPRVWMGMLLEDAAVQADLGDHARAIELWQQALEVPLWGATVEDRVRPRLAEAKLDQQAEELAAVFEAAVDGGVEEEELAVYRRRAEAHRQALRALGEVLGAAERQRRLIATHLQEAELLFQQNALRHWEEVLAIYRAAGELPGAEGFARWPVHRSRAQGLEAFAEGLELEDEGRADRAAERFSEATRKVPSFAPARDRLASYRAARQEVERTVERARSLLEEGARQSVFERAAERYRQAREQARRVLERDPDNEVAGAVAREADWRLDAGPGMVFFEMADGTIFAIDRYEYPNEEGAVPRAVSFVEARRLAREAGKQLPTPAQWQRVAAGREGRTYPWGDIFDPAKVRASVSGRSTGPAPAGSHPAGATPEGVHDLSGNLAEWVDEGQGEDPRAATALGGHFGSSAPEELTTRSRQRSSNPQLAGKYTGFRCVKVYRSAEE